MSCSLSILPSTQCVQLFRPYLSSQNCYDHNKLLRLDGGRKSSILEGRRCCVVVLLAEPSQHSRHSDAIVSVFATHDVLWWRSEEGVKTPKDCQQRAYTQESSLTTIRRKYYTGWGFGIAPPCHNCQDIQLHRSIWKLWDGVLSIQKFPDRAIHFDLQRMRTWQPAPVVMVRMSSLTKNHVYKSISLNPQNHERSAPVGHLTDVFQKCGEEAALWLHWLQFRVLSWFGRPPPAGLQSDTPLTTHYRLGALRLLLPPFTQ